MIDAGLLVARAVERGVAPPVWVPETTSTQDAVRTWAAARRPEGLSLVAEVQTEGRGRHGRSWAASRGKAVLLSVLLRPQLPPARLGLVPLAVAVAVRAATHGRLAIKWPNDLLAPDGRKVAGILCEGDVSGGRVAWVVAGVGVNVHGVPRDVLGVACLDEIGPPTSREELAVEIVARTLHSTRQVEQEPARMLRAWRLGSATLGRRVRVGGAEGVAEDVAEDGALLLRRDDGVLQRVVAGDVSMVQEDEQT